MGAVSATKTSYPNSVVSVTSTDSTSYPTLLNSMGSFVYGIRELYLKADDNSQILQSYKFNRYDVNGTLQSFYEVPLIDPYQYQSSIFAKIQKNDVYLDGRTNLNFSILPNETLYMILYTNQIANRDFVPATDFFNDEFFNRQYNVLNGYQELL